MMKKTFQILALLGTGLAIGSIAGKYLKEERKQLEDAVKKIVHERSLKLNTKISVNNDELESCFI